MMSYEEVRQIVQDMKDGTYNMTNNGKCTGCGKCCSNYLPMTASEISTIKNYIKSIGSKNSTIFHWKFWICRVRSLIIRNHVINVRFIRFDREYAENLFVIRQRENQ